MAKRLDSGIRRCPARMLAVELNSTPPQNVRDIDATKWIPILANNLGEEGLCVQETCCDIIDCPVLT